MKDELVARIVQLLNTFDIDGYQFQQRLLIILGDYNVTKSTKELALPSPQMNEQIIERFLMSKGVAGRSNKTLRYYGKTLKLIFEKINLPYSSIKADDIRLYLAYRQMRDGISKTTANNEQRCLRSFYSWCIAEEVLTYNPMLKIESIKVEKREKPAFTETEVELIRDACRSNKETAIIETLLSTGCRVSELAGIRLDEIKEDRILVHGKGNKDRTVYLNAKAQLAIQKYLSERKDNNPFFLPKGIMFTDKRFPPEAHAAALKGKSYTVPESIEPNGHQDKSSIECTVRKIGKRAGVDHVHPHRFRRTCATFALRHGMPIEQVSKMLGHEQIATTQIYLNLSESELEYAHRKYVV